jgi:hypothetical protein
VATSQEYTISRKVSDTEEEIIQIPYDALANKPDLSVYQTKTDASLETTDKTVVGAINEVVTGVAGTLESFGMSLAPQENGKLNKKVYVFPDGSLASGTSYDASKDLYLSIGDGLTLETIDEANNIWNIKSGSAITSVDGLGGGAISGDVSTSGSLTVGGSLTVNGTTTTVDSTTLQVKDKLIEVAHGNTTKLTTPAGLVAPKYDGANSGALVFDGDGTAYVGDVKLDSTGNIDVAKSELQPLATRTGLVDGNLVQYDSTAQTLKDSGKKISDLATTSQVNAKYTKPSGGIPKTDLASDVQTSLGKADTALQSAPVTSVNGKTGAVQLGASDVGALPSSTKFVSSVNGKTGAVTGLATQDEVNAKQNTLTETQLAAVNSGVTQAKITKYEGYDATIKQKVNVSDLAKVATSGSYNDLTNKPTIPTVNDGTLTIQKNGETVGTFTANQKDGTTANITVPTKASDVNALSLDGGTINKSKTVKMDASANSNGANLKWGTVNSKNPYIGYASDQADGTFVVGSLLGTNYASGLAIGGGSGNLLWKGAKVATTGDIPPKVTESTVSGWGFTKNKGTVTSVSVKMNGEIKGTITSSGTIDLGALGGTLKWVKPSSLDELSSITTIYMVTNLVVDHYSVNGICKAVSGYTPVAVLNCTDYDDEYVKGCVSSEISTTDGTINIYGVLVNTYNNQTVSVNATGSVSIDDILILK